MKQISITIALALLCTIANAQNITGSHQVRVNDEVKKQQVEYVAVDSTGQGMVWDLSEAEFTKGEPTADYTEQIREPSPDLSVQNALKSAGLGVSVKSFEKERLFYEEKTPYLPGNAFMYIKANNVGTSLYRNK